jgi:hypothetical protein
MPKPNGTENTATIAIATATNAKTPAIPRASAPGSPKSLTSNSMTTASHPAATPIKNMPTRNPRPCLGRKRARSAITIIAMPRHNMIPDQIHVTEVGIAYSNTLSDGAIARAGAGWPAMGWRHSCLSCSGSTASSIAATCSKTSPPRRADRAGACEDDGGLRVSMHRGGAVVPYVPTGERRTLQAVQGIGGGVTEASISPGGWHRTSMYTVAQALETYKRIAPGRAEPGRAEPSWSDVARRMPDMLPDIQRGRSRCREHSPRANTCQHHTCRLG